MRLIRALVPLALAGALLAGCGGDQNGGGGTTADTQTSATPADNGMAALEPDAIVDKAVAALGSAKSFSLKGNINTEGQKFGLDLKASGDDLLGTLTLNGAKVELLRVAGEAYIRPDEELWKQYGGKAGATMSQLMGDRWAKLSAKNSDFEDFFKIADPAELLKPDGKLSKGDTKTINGVPAIGIAESGSDGGTLYVATTGEPYPLQLAGPAGEGELNFGDYGATFDEIKAPAAEDVIDLDKLIGK